MDNFDHAIVDWMNNYNICQINTWEVELESFNLLEFMTGPETDVKLQLKNTVEPTF